MNKVRIAVSALALSASALVGIAVHEGYSPVAYRPVPGDVPTIASMLGGAVSWVATHWGGK